jgi:hypothetical protein
MAGSAATNEQAAAAAQESSELSDAYFYQSDGSEGQDGFDAGKMKDGAASQARNMQVAQTMPEAEPAEGRPNESEAEKERDRDPATVPTRGAGAPLDYSPPPLTGDRAPETPKETFDPDFGYHGLPRGGVYRIFGPDDEEWYVGRSNNANRRESEHGRDERFQGGSFEVLHRTDDPATLRGLEQLEYEQREPTMNAIRPISPRNSRGEEYLNKARDFLKGKPDS